MNKKSFSFLILFTLCLKSAIAQIEFQNYFGKTKSIESTIQLDSKTSVKLIEFAKSDIKNTAEGSKSTFIINKKVDIGNNKGEMLITRLFSRLVWKDDNNVIIYDSENPFERTDLGDSFAEQWDKFIKKPFKLKYSKIKTDTLSKDKDFMYRWKYSYLPVEDMSKFPEWDYFLLASAMNKPLIVGSEWSDSTLVEDRINKDRFIVTSLSNDDVIITYFRKSSPKTATGITKFTESTEKGMYFISEDVTGIIKINKNSLLINTMDFNIKRERVNVEESHRIEITVETKATIKNKIL